MIPHRELSTTEKADRYDRLTREIAYRRPSIDMVSGKIQPGRPAPHIRRPEDDLLWAFDKAIDRLKRAKLN